MATLVELKDAIDAGKTIQKKNECADGYEALGKLENVYCYVYGFEREYFDTWDALYERAEPDGKYLEEQGDTESLDSWEIETPLTEEEQAHWKPFADAFEAGDKDAAIAFVVKDIETKIEERKEEMLAREANGRTRYTLAECEAYVNDGKIVRCVNNSKIALYRWKEYIVLAIDGVQQFFTTFPDVMAQVAKLSYIDYVGHLTQRATWYVAEDSKSFEILGSPVALEV